jgi:hypothetical protein
MFDFETKTNQLASSVLIVKILMKIYDNCLFLKKFQKHTQTHLHTYTMRDMTIQRHT